MALQDCNTQQSGIKRFVRKYFLLGVLTCLFKQLKPDPLFTTRWAVQILMFVVQLKYRLLHLKHTFNNNSIRVWRRNVYAKPRCSFQALSLCTKRCYKPGRNAKRNTNLCFSHPSAIEIFLHDSRNIRKYKLEVPLICRFRILLFCTVHHLLSLSM